MTASLADFTLSSASRQYLSVPVVNTISGTNPTGTPPTLAFPAPGEEPVTFYDGDWATASGLYYAQCLVGPSGTVELDTGYYDVYVKFSSDPEEPVLYAGLLEVT